MIRSHITNTAMLSARWPTSGRITRARRIPPTCFSTTPGTACPFSTPPQRFVSGFWFATKLHPGAQRRSGYEGDACRRSSPRPSKPRKPVEACADASSRADAHSANTLANVELAPSWRQWNRRGPEGLVCALQAPNFVSFYEVHTLNTLHPSSWLWLQVPNGAIEVLPVVRRIERTDTSVTIGIIVAPLMLSPLINVTPCAADASV